MAEKDERPCTSCEPTRGGKAAAGAWPKTLYLLRHGETELNVERKIQGWCDSPLTERGRDQARRARTSLERAGVEIDYACGSSLGRARQTAEIVTDVPYVPMDELKEWSFGSYEGESRLSMPPAPWGDFFGRGPAPPCREPDARSRGSCASRGSRYRARRHFDGVPAHVAPVGPA